MVGYLPAVKGEVPGRQGISISGAATLAIERINADPQLLPGVKLDLVWDDTEVTHHWEIHVLLYFYRVFYTKNLFF